MNTLRPFARHSAFALAAAGLVTVFGCSDNSGLGKRYAVSGTVSYNGKPVEKGTITFKPATDSESARAASGDIKDGKYSLTTAEPGDGALPGSYKVTVVAKDMDTAELTAAAKGGQHHHDAAFAKAVKTAKALVPAKYQIPDTSGLTAEVKESSNSIPFDLKD